MPLINVKDEHFDKATRKNGRHCAVAIAIAETMPDAKFINVMPDGDPTGIRFSQGDYKFRMEAPKSVVDAVRAWDDGASPGRFGFVVDFGKCRRARRTSRPATALIQPNNTTIGRVGRVANPRRSGGSRTAGK